MSGPHYKSYVSPSLVLACIACVVFVVSCAEAWRVQDCAKITGCSVWTCLMSSSQPWMIRGCK